MERDAVINFLIEEFDYTKTSAMLTVSTLEKAAPDIRRAFEHWLNTGEITDMEVEGYTVQKLVEAHNIKIPGAFSTLDWLRREPEKALATLKKGFDKIV